MSSWGCPHEVDGLCERVNRAYCVPGMKGCVLYGKVVFPDGEERLPSWPGRETGRTACAETVDSSAGGRHFEGDQAQTQVV